MLPTQHAASLETHDGNATSLIEPNSPLSILKAMPVQVDNLRTNKRGTYVLKDANFGWLRRLSAARGDPHVRTLDQLYEIGAMQITNLHGMPV